jgi:hypothetical protein
MVDNDKSLPPIIDKTPLIWRWFHTQSALIFGLYAAIFNMNGGNDWLVVMTMMLKQFWQKNMTGHSQQWMGVKLFTNNMTTGPWITSPLRRKVLGFTTTNQKASLGNSQGNHPRNPNIWSGYSWLQLVYIISYLISSQVYDHCQLLH